MKEHQFEDIISRYPELIEKGIVLKGRQVNVDGKYVDLLFEDRHEQKLIIELKKGSVLREHVGQILDYAGYFLSPDEPTVRVMLVGNHVPPNLRRSLDHHGIEWKALPFSRLIDFLKKEKDEEYLKYFSKEDIDSTSTKKKSEPRSKDMSQKKRTLNVTKRKAFFEQLLALSNKKSHIFRGKAPESVTESTDFLGKNAGKTSLDWNYDARRKRLCVGLSFFNKNHRVNEMRILALQEKKQEIHTAFGEDLDWGYKQGRSYQYIRSYTQVGSLKDEDKWSEIQGDLVNRLIRLERVMRDHIAALE